MLAKKEVFPLPYRIIVDLSDRHLYLLDDNVDVRGFPVGIGAVLTETPTGEYTIVNKIGRASCRERV